MKTLNCWMCRHPNVSRSTNKQLIESIIGEELTLECPICYEAFDSDNLFFTECKHYACVKCTDSISKKNANDQSNQIPSDTYGIDHQLVRSDITSAIERATRNNSLIEIYNNNIIISNIASTIDNFIIANNNNSHMEDPD